MSQVTKSSRKRKGFCRRRRQRRHTPFGHFTLSLQSRRCRLTLDPAARATSSQNSPCGIRDTVLPQSILPWLSFCKISCFLSSHSATTVVGASVVVVKKRAQPRPRLAVKARETREEEEAQRLCIVTLARYVGQSTTDSFWNDFRQQQQRQQRQKNNCVVRHPREDRNLRTPRQPKDSFV